MKNNKVIPFRTLMMSEPWYLALDPGIRFPVRVLHAAGIETCQSCQGGEDAGRPHRGHAYDRPTVDLIARGGDSIGFAAVSALQDFGLKVRDLSLVWSICHGLPYEKLWRVTLCETWESRADEIPNFIWGYQAQ
jgi:hypothetical protein